jgi:hypothetical protein
MYRAHIHNGSLPLIVSRGGYMKKAIGELIEEITWTCPYKKCGALNTQQGYFDGLRQLLNCSECGKESEIEIQ